MGDGEAQGIETVAPDGVIQPRRSMTLIEDDTSAATGAETDAAGESTTIDSQATNDAIVDKTPQDEPAPEVELGPAIHRPWAAASTSGRTKSTPQRWACLMPNSHAMPASSTWGDRRVFILVTGPSGTQNTLRGVRLLQGDEHSPQKARATPPGCPTKSVRLQSS